MSLLPLWLLASVGLGGRILGGDQDEVFGEVQVVAARYEDTFVSLARTYNVGYEALRRANPGVDPWLPGEGTKIVIPTQFVLPRAPHRGIVVNVAELRLYYFPADAGTAPDGTPAGSRRVITHPISIGKMDWSTPLGTTSITGKVANPSWTPPQSIRDEHAARNDILPRVVPAGPDNPLGKHALRLGLAGVSDPRHEQAVGRRHARDARLHSHVPRGCRGALQDGARRNVGDDRESAVQARLDRRRFVSRGASAARESSAGGLREEIDEPSTRRFAQSRSRFCGGIARPSSRARMSPRRSRERPTFAGISPKRVLMAARGVPEFVSVAAAGAGDRIVRGRSRNGDAVKRIRITIRA